MKHTRWQALAVLVMALLPAWAGAVVFEVTIDTTPLAGRGGYMALDLLAGSPGAVNTVQLGSFTSTATLGVATTTGDVSGSLAGTLTLTSSVFFNELLQAVVFNPGPTHFTLTVSDNTVAGGVPDTLSFFLLDTNFVPFATGDPAGALFLIDLRAPVLPQTFSSSFASVTVLAVPEPGRATLMMLGLGLAVMAWRQKILKASHR
jgi:hypothetical protein